MSRLMPGTTAELVGELDRMYPEPPALTPEQLSDESARIDYAVALGERRVALQLKQWHHYTTHEIRKRAEAE